MAKAKKEEKVQRDLNFAIVDEVDSILIDEARTPLIISGTGDESNELYIHANNCIKTLVEEDYEIEEKDLQAGDLILMQIESPKTNHAAILVSDNIILHHLYGRPSCKGVYGGYWRDRTTRLLRHKLLRGEDE